MPEMIQRFKYLLPRYWKPAPAWEPRLWFGRVLLAAGGLLLGIAGLVIGMDPFQVYRRPRFPRPVFENAYYSIPGLIRNYDYDGVVIGSSMCQNFRLSEISRQLGWKPIKLTPSGCRPATVRLFLDQVWRTRPVRHVLLGLDLFGFEFGADEHRVDIPVYLYDDTPWNDYRYFWNQSVAYGSIKELLKANLSRKPQRRQKLDADRMWAWDFEDGRIAYGREAVLKAELFHGGLEVNVLNDGQLNPMLESFDRNILEPIQARPLTEFVIFLPPYSVVAWSKISERGAFEVFVKFRELVIQALVRETNVRLYDFQTETEIFCDLDNYKDSTHYSPAVSRLILERIGRDRNRLHPDDQQIVGGGALLRRAVADFRKGWAAGGN